MEREENNSRQASQYRQFAELSRQVVDDTLVESTYRAGYTTFRVKSTFTGTSTLYDAVRAIATQKLATQHED